MTNLINDYFNITGRPIATMTVAEFLEFKRFCGEENGQNTMPAPEPVKFSVHEEKTEVAHKSSPVTNKTEKSRKSTALEMLKSVNG